jgi:heme exporter protein CcmD
MMAFFDMGGYGGFIWPSYGITFAALIWLFFASWRRAQNAARQLGDAEASKQSQP